MLCVTGVNFRDITNMIFVILLLNVSHLNVCSCSSNSLSVMFMVAPVSTRKVTGVSKTCAVTVGFAETELDTANIYCTYLMNHFQSLKSYSLAHDFVASHIWEKCPVLLQPPEQRPGCLMSPPCLESQGLHLIPLYHLLSCSSAESCYSFCLFFSLLAGPFSSTFS